MKRLIGMIVAAAVLILTIVFVAVWATPRLSRAAALQLSVVVARSDIASIKNGYGLCLFDSKGPLWSDYGGVADEVTQSPFTEDTVFRAGAVSELFTSALILDLADKGKLRLEDPVKVYLGDLFRSGTEENLGKIGELKIATLLGHLSGSDADYFLGYQDYDPSKNIARFLEETSLRYPPGVKYIRAGAYIDLLGCVVERVDGEPFERAVQGTIFSPLGMRSSSFKYRKDPRYADIRYKSAGPNSYATDLPGLWNVVVPSASMQTSIQDLSTFFSTLLGGNKTRNYSVSSKTLSRMFSSQSMSTKELQGIDIGSVWMLSLPELDYLGRIAWYSGQFLSHRNVVILALDLGCGVVVATNAWHIFDTATILPLAVDILKT